MKGLIPLALLLVNAFFSFAQSGSIDPTFGVNGKLVENFGFAQFQITSGAIQSDGRIIIAGYVENGKNGHRDADFFLTRFNADGSIDNAFGNNGIVYTDIATNSPDYLSKVMLLPNGKILAVGGKSMALYNANGQLDTGYYGTGKSLSNTLIEGSYVDVQALPDGRILIAAFFLTNTFGKHLTLYWLQQDGSIDKKSGLQKFTESSDFAFDVHSVCLLPDGKVLTAGSHHDEPYIARHKANGSIDSTFGINGRIFQDPAYIGGTTLNLNSDSTRFYTCKGSKSPDNYFDTVYLQRHLVDGTPDATFGTGSVAIFPRDSSRIIYDQSLQYAITADNKILKGGTTTNALGIDQFSAVKLLPDGSLDNSFGNNGVLPAIGGGTRHEIALVLTQPDVKSIMAGYKLLDGKYCIALSRVNADGSADNSFNQGAMATVAVSAGTISNDFGQDILELPDGRILASCMSQNGLFASLVLAKYKAGGTRDSTFGVDGVVYCDAKGVPRYEFNSFTLPQNGNSPMSTDANGNIYVLAPHYHSARKKLGCTVLKFSPAGQRDSSFGDYGRKIIYLPNLKYNYPVGMAIQPDGKPVIALHTQYYTSTDPDSSYITLLRLNTDGSSDLSFGTNGQLRENQFTGETPIRNQTKRLIIQPDGKILLCGEAKVPRYVRWGIRRYNADGTVDQQFNKGIMVTTHVVPNAYNVATAIALQPDGKLLVAGNSAGLPNPGGAVVVRYTASGSLDYTFGDKGIKTSFLGLTSPYDNLSNVIVQADGKILVAGDAAASDKSYILLGRLLADGTLDSAFGYNGTKTISTSGIMHDLNGAALVTKSGRILVVGATQLITDNGYGQLGNFVIYGLNNTIANCSAITADAGHDTVVCSGDSVWLGSPAVPGYRYKWSPDYGLSSTTTAQTTALTYSGALYWVTVKDASGCVAIDCVFVTVNRLPEQPIISPSGPFLICGGNVQLSTTATGSLQWLHNGAIIAGATNTSYRAAATGQYAVKVTDNNTCSATSRSVIVTVDQPPTPTITAGGPLSFCQGSSVALLAGETIAGSVQWLKNGYVIAGATSNTYNATTSGQYTVWVKNINNCYSISPAVDVTVYPAPPAPVITQNGSTLQSSVSTGNQWHLNGTAITGATAATYTATTSGVYTVKVALNGCESTMSNAINLVPTGINSPELDKRIVMAPNPVIDYLNINYTGNVGRFTITVHNIFGLQVYGSGSFNSTCRLDMRSYAAGVYTVHIVNILNGEQIHRLIMKQ